MVLGFRQTLPRTPYLGGIVVDPLVHHEMSSSGLRHAFQGLLIDCSKLVPSAEIAGLPKVAKAPLLFDMGCRNLAPLFYRTIPISELPAGQKLHHLSWMLLRCVIPEILLHAELCLPGSSRKLHLGQGPS